MERRLPRVAVGLVAAALLAGCALLPSGGPRDAFDDPTPTPIPTSVIAIKPTYTVQRGEVVRSLEFLGRIAPVVEATLFFNVGGRVRSVYVRRGDDVAAGQALADLQVDDLERERAAAQLALERAEARLAAAEAELAAQQQRAELNLQIAQLNVQMAQARDLTPRTALAQAELVAARLAQQQAQADYDAAVAAGAGAAAAAITLQQANVTLARAQAAYDTALQDVTVRELDLAVKERLVALAQIALDELGEDVDPLLANEVQQARLNVQRLDAALANAKIVAPFDGQVMFFALVEGQTVDAFKAVAVVADLRDLEVRADVTGSTTQQLAVGMDVTVVLSTRPSEPLTGTIRRVPYSAADEDRATRISLEAPAADAGFELGDLARITVVLERHADALWLPPQAIRTFEGRQFVVVQEGEVQRRVDVETGIAGDGRTEIVAGLSEGQLVVSP